MGEYVEIKTSPAEIMSIAQGISAKGTALSGTAGEIQKDIADQAARAETFPSDKFTDSFKNSTQYDQPVEYAPGKSAPTHEAIALGAVGAGEKLREIGEFVGEAMMNYSAQDDDNATDVKKALPDK